MDQPSNAGPSDMVFRSTADPKITYSFPVGLSRIGRVTAYRSTPTDDMAISTVDEAVLLDSQSHCWNNVRPGTFCLRDGP